MQIETVWVGFTITIGLNAVGLAISYGRTMARLDAMDRRQERMETRMDGLFVPRGAAGNGTGHTESRR